MVKSARLSAEELKIVTWRVQRFLKIVEGHRKLLQAIGEL